MSAARVWLLALAACTDGGIASTQQAIVGGTVDPGDPAVVAIAHRPIACGDAPVAFCSGVLVAPRVVLTAAHCVTGLEPKGLEVVFGDNVASPSPSAATAIIVQAAQIYTGYDASTGDGDVAALLLAEAATVAPIAAPTASMADVGSGAALRTVGFGVTSWTANDPGTKRDGTMTLGEVRAQSFDATPGPALSCAADSGGPVFATINSGEQLVGLTSRGDAACATHAVNARVDVVQSPFVDPFVAASASEAPGWSGTGIGTTDCAVDADCPALMTCIDARSCGFAWLGDGAFGAACTGDAGCGAGPTARCARVWPSGADACHCFASSIAPPGPDAGTGGDDGGSGCGCSARGGSSNVPSSAPSIVVALLVIMRRRRARRVRPVLC